MPIEQAVQCTNQRMEGLAINALLVQLDMPELVSVGEVPPAPGAKGFGGRAALSSKPEEEKSVRRPVWPGKDYQLQRSSVGKAQRGYWRSLSPLTSPVAAPLEWVEPVLG